MDAKDELSIKDQEDELIDRAKLLYEHQKEQYESASDRVRRLEDKATKTFSALSIIITIALLILRYWWDDLFPKKYDPLHGFCWFFLGFFFVMSAISWGYIFSAMQLQEIERPSVNPNEMESFYMGNKRYNALTAYAKEYSRLTSAIDIGHSDKARLIANCYESILYGAWSFVCFIIIFFLIKLHV